VSEAASTDVDQLSPGTGESLITVGRLPINLDGGETSLYVTTCRAIEAIAEPVVCSDGDLLRGPEAAKGQVLIGSQYPGDPSNFAGNYHTASEIRAPWMPRDAVLLTTSTDESASTPHRLVFVESGVDSAFSRQITALASSNQATATTRLSLERGTTPTSVVEATFLSTLILLASVLALFTVIIGAFKLTGDHKR